LFAVRPPYSPKNPKNDPNNPNQIDVGDYVVAVGHYTDAIAADPKIAAFYTNRSVSVGRIKMMFINWLSFATSISLH
jgi:hypothetical protein